MSDVDGYNPVFSDEELEKDRWVGGADTVPDDAVEPFRHISDIMSSDDYGKGLPPITTGFRSIDAQLGGGMRPESVYVLAARTGQSKSTFFANMVRKMALDGVSVLIHKLEESAKELCWRIHAACAQVPMNRLLDGGQHSAEVAAKLEDGLHILRDLPIRISTERNLDAILRTSRRHVETDGQVVLVDQLSMIGVDAAVGYAQATTASNALRMMARDLGVAVGVVCQINRAASKATERLTLNDIRDSGAIENDAAGVLMIDRIEKPAQEWGQGQSVFTIELSVTKNRYGRVTPKEQPIKLSWHPAICRIEEPGMRVVK